MYIIDFDVAAVIVLAIAMHLFYLQKNVANAQSRIFAALLWASMGSAASSALSSFAINAMPVYDPSVALAVTTVFYAFHNTIPILAALYALSFGRSYIGNIALKALFLLPWALSMALILSNWALSLVFYIDGDLVYRHGVGLTVLYYNSAVYLIVVLWAIGTGMQRLSVIQRLAFLSAMVMPIVAIVVQNFVPGLLLECFSASMGMLWFLLTVQNSKELIDGQTGLFTREAFTQFLQQGLDSRSRFSAIIVNSREMSGLQGVLDIRSYGEIVRSFASSLAREAGKASVVCALDEGLFAIIPDRRRGDVFSGELALAILERAKEAWKVDTLQIELPANIGILRFPEDSNDALDIMDRIEQLARLPVQIGNRHIFYANDLIPGRRARETAIGRALGAVIDDGTVALRYQPVFSVREGRIVAIEALIGFMAEDGDWIRQSEILKVAERMGIAQKLGEIILETACDWFVQNDLAGKGIAQLQVRLLESQCVELDWPRSVMRVVKERGMESIQLCLEITEPSVVNVGENLKLNMELLAGQEIKFALDDYGSGYTDLDQILEMPFSIIKIDKQVVYAGLRSAKGQKLLAGSVSLFKRLGRAIVAEGVETAEQDEFLRGAGCDFLQGYRFGFPMYGDELLALLSEETEHD